METTPSRTNLSPVLCGISGEYFVAAELSRRGYIASVTLRNTKGVDILASNANASRTVAIQVKTNQGLKRQWILARKNEHTCSEGQFYVFVNLKGLKNPPDYFVVPSKDVSDYLKRTHQEWLKAPGRKGQVHRDNAIRNFADPEGKYQNRWDILGLDTEP